MDALEFTICALFLDFAMGLAVKRPTRDKHYAGDSNYRVGGDLHLRSTISREIKMNNLRNLRKQKNLTIVEVAEEIGVPKMTILSWEHGTSQISMGKAKKLAKYFGVSVGYLLGLDTPAKDGIAELIDKVNEWAISHGLDKGNPKIEWMKVTEEVGEIRDVFLKPHDFANPEWSLKDAIGDSIVTLVVLCLQLGYDVEECLTIAYNDIKDREGVMIDDNFVKTKTRESANSSDDSASAIAGD